MIAIAGRKPLGWITAKDRARLVGDEETMGVRIVQEAFASDDVPVFDLRPSLDEAMIRAFVANKLKGRLKDEGEAERIAHEVATGLVEGGEGSTVATERPVTETTISAEGEPLRALTVGELVERLTDLSDLLESPQAEGGRIMLARRPAAAAAVRIRQAANLLTGRVGSDL